MKPVDIGAVGKSAASVEGDSTKSLRTIGLTLIRLPRKFSKLMVAQPVPQTDTGSREEYSQVLE